MLMVFLYFLAILARRAVARSVCLEPQLTSVRQRAVKPALILSRSLRNFIPIPFCCDALRRFRLTLRQAQTYTHICTHIHTGERTLQHTHNHTQHTHTTSSQCRSGSSALVLCFVTISISFSADTHTHTCSLAHSYTLSLTHSLTHVHSLALSCSTCAQFSSSLVLRASLLFWSPLWLRHVL